jgi:hypothetical protein
MIDNVIGGVGLTHLKVYDQRPGPDGINAGCAHIHALTDEAYFGITGKGSLELHDIERGFRTVPIVKGTFIQFEAGTLHRSVSMDGLEVVALMGNGGLPERGDARIYFGPGIDDDPAEFERLKGLVDDGLEGALARRDASAIAYQKLLHLWETDQHAYRAELMRFLGVHRAAIADRQDAFRNEIESGPVKAGETALARCAGLTQSRSFPVPDISYANVGTRTPTLGMCGILRQVTDLEKLL